MTFLMRVLYIIYLVRYERAWAVESMGRGIGKLEKDNPAARTPQRYADNGNPFP